MLTIMKKVWRDQSGQDLAEYGIALAVVTLAVAAAAISIGTNLQAIWNAASAVIASIAAGV
jgi:pilus assembly protein Flp/PilA